MRSLISALNRQRPLNVPDDVIIARRETISDAITRKPFAIAETALWAALHSGLATEELHILLEREEKYRSLRCL
jgi:hypothetical protein